MPFCTYCGTSFTRDEHLERHILTHTNIKPYKCSDCHMSFARRDLLQRHFTVHGKDQNNQEVTLPNNGMLPKTAGRTPIACTNCAKTKTKCDKKFPCSRCASRNLTCTMRPNRRATKQTTGKAEQQQPQSTRPSRTGTPAEIDESHDQSESSSPQESSPGPLQHEGAIEPTSQNPTVHDGQATDSHVGIFDQSPQTSAGASVVPNMISPVPTPNGYLSHSRISSYDAFTQPGTTIHESNTSPFFMDWTQLQMAGGYDPQMMMISPEIGMDMCAITAEAATDGMLNAIPGFPQSLPHMPTPLQTPRIDQPFGGDIDMSCSSNSAQSMFFPPGTLSSTRHPSVSDSGVADLGAVVAAQDGWNVFRCAPSLPPHVVPKTARANLERLEASLKNHEAWSTWRPTWDEGDGTAKDQFLVMQLHESTRDKLLAITQAFLHKALDTHREAIHTPVNEMSQTAWHYSSNFVLLPPARVLECFLRSYSNSFETFFPLSPRGIVDANELLSYYNDKAGSLLILLMIAQGAMVMPSAEARALTGGLTEACRISLFDAIEKNISLASDAAILRAALLFIVQAAWSGDKWQMDIAMGQRGMYLAMLRHSGMLSEASKNGQTTPSPVSHNATPDGLWREWTAQESRSRLIYSYVMVDQDLSFFHDSAPLLNVSEFSAPMPDVDRLWHAKSAQEWTDAFTQAYEFNDRFPPIDSNTSPMCLRDLFRHFLDDDIANCDMNLTPLQLRLLLHPLQSLVCQYCQLLSCFSDTLRSRNGSRAVTAASARLRLEEVQTLLQRWYDLAAHYLEQNPLCPVMQANLTMFHLISLNAVTNFTEIEKLARREGVDGSYQQLLWLHKRCISDVEEAMFHAGQVLRLVRGMDRIVRPPWWPGAIYRVALVLWTDALRHNDAVSSNNNFSIHSSPQSSRSGSSGNLFQRPTHSRSHSSMSLPASVNVPVDNLPADHPMILSYLTKREGTPVLTTRDGALIAIDNAFTVLSHCVDILDEGIPTRFSDGIRGKLERLTRG